jgi:hypothetical protein
VATLAKVNGKKQFRHTVANVLEVLGAMRGHPYVLALGSHMHAPEHASFMSDGVELRSEVSAAIVGGQEVGPVIIPSGLTLYRVRGGKIDAGQFVRLDAPRVKPYDGPPRATPGNGPRRRGNDRTWHY